MATLYITKDQGDVLLRFVPAALELFVMQLAANLISECPSFPVDEDTHRTEGSGGLITQRMYWAAPHGALNAFQQQADIVYNYAEAVVGGRIVIKTSGQKQFLQLLVDALSAYQKWKAAYCADIQRRKGSNFGSGTEFFKKDWADLNPKLLVFLEPVKAG